MVSAFFASRSPCFLHQCSNLRLIFPISSWISLDWCFDVEFDVILVFYLIWRCAFHEICCNGTWLKEKKEMWFMVSRLFRFVMILFLKFQSLYIVWMGIFIYIYMCFESNHMSELGMCMRILIWGSWHGSIILIIVFFLYCIRDEHHRYLLPCGSIWRY